VGEWGNLATARRGLGSAGTQTEGLAFGGYTGTVDTAATEEYNGSAWTAGGNMATARRLLAGAGIQTSALAFGGYTTGNVTNAQKNMMVVLGQLVEIWEQLDVLAGCWNSNSRFSFWWIHNRNLQHNRRI
jgi:hypothetical protein